MAAVAAVALHSAPHGLFAADHPAASDESWGSELEWVGEPPLLRCALRTSGGASKIECQLSYLQAIFFCHQQHLRDVFCRT